MEALTPPELRKILRKIKLPLRQLLGILLADLIASIMILRSGGSLDAVLALTGLTVLLAFVIPVMWRIITGKELLQGIEGFHQEQVDLMVKTLMHNGIQVTVLETLAGGKSGFEPLAPFETFKNLAHLQLISHEVDLVHIGYWTDKKVETETFYLDFAVNCKIVGESRLRAVLSMMKRFIVFGRRRPKWWGAELAQLLNHDEVLKDGLVNVYPIMEIPAFWIIPNAEEQMVRIHIPYVKRVDPEQFPSILAVAERIAKHIKSLA